MTTVDEMGLTRAVAQGYESYFVPAIFAQWPSTYIRLAHIGHGDDVLDVGCGTGVLTRELIPVVGASGGVIGVDLSESMLSVAREMAPGATFRQASVSALPFDDETFDSVVAAFMLMFVPDPTQAIREMWRVTRSGGRVVVGVWEALDANPVYTELVSIVTEVIDEKAGNSIAWPFALGTKGKLGQIISSAGAAVPELGIHSGVAKFPSIDEFVRTEIESWLLADSISEQALSEITDKARVGFSSYCDGEGQMTFPFNASVAVSVK